VPCPGAGAAGSIVVLIIVCVERTRVILHMFIPMRNIRVRPADSPLWILEVIGWRHQ
jgi:hypothetical protein